MKYVSGSKVTGTLNHVDPHDIHDAEGIPLLFIFMYLMPFPMLFHGFYGDD
jgi:hypothetical protein